MARDLVLISLSAAIGALVSLLAARLFSSSSSSSSSNNKSNSKRPPQPPPPPPPPPCLLSHPLPNDNGSAEGAPKLRSPFDPSKREGYISWDDYFMAIAFLSAQRSKDPNRQVGACLKSRNGDPLETKYPYVVHAEVNAILNTNHASAAGQKLYVTMFPCNECAKIIIQSRVSEVIYYVDKRVGNSDAAYIASHNLLCMAGVKVRKHQPQMRQILVKFQEP